GKKTAGVDGMKSLTPPQRLKLISDMDLHTPVKPVRRVWIDKPGKPEKRPLVPHPLLILGYSRFNFVRASSILNCQSTPRCLALVLSAQSPISDWSKGSSPMRRSVRHGLLRQLNSHSATFNQLPCFGVYQNSIRLT